MFTLVLFDASNYLVREFFGETLNEVLAQAQLIWDNRIEHDDYIRREIYQDRVLVESITCKGNPFPRSRGTYETYFMA